MKSVNGNAKLILFSLLMAVCLWFISCKSTDTNVSETENTIQEEVDALAADTEEEQSEEIAAEEVAEEPVEEAPQLTVEEERALKKATLTREQRLFYSIKYTYDYEVIGEDLDYKITVDHDAKTVTLQYEETDSEEDWKNNYLFFPWPLKLDNKVIWTTYGYAKIYKSSQNIPINQFCELLEQYPDYQSVILGWSLGSAMAKITARHYIIRSPKGTKIDQLTTYGDVKCWYNPFFSLKKNCVRIREYVNNNDMITWCIPFCRRDVKCRVGDYLNLGKLKNSEYYHTHYEDCDFTRWGDVSAEEMNNQSKVKESNSAITEEESEVNS
ncbi:MAG: hypothetical protein IK024_11250 [Treponema sp.]|nr:hypothetical protein [Treponema sp.]